MEIAIPEQVEWIIKKLRAGGFEAFAVGGCVRDALLHRTPGDWDITTSAKPDEVKRIFGRTIDTGLQHGTVTVLREGVGYEITTYRIDGEYEDGRHPKEVSFTSELREDLRRRDFTINAMAYSRETGVVDIFGGMEDLEKRRIRCVGDPMERFTEDALRILRAIRFSAGLDFSIEEETYRALSAIAPNLAHVSKERIQTELTKTLLSAYPGRIRLVEETGMSRYISGLFPEAFSRGTPPSGRELDRAAALGLKPEKALRWAAFLAGCGEETAEKILRELKMDNDTIGKVRTYVRWLPLPLQEEEISLRRVMSQMSGERFDGLIELKEMFSQGGERRRLPRIRAIARSIRENKDCIRMKDMAVTGTDLIAAGIRPGPELGKLLDELFAQVLEHPEWNRREVLMGKVRGRRTAQTEEGGVHGR